MNKLIAVFERVLSLLVVVLLLTGTVVWTGQLFGRYIGGSAPDYSGIIRVEGPDERQIADLGLAGMQLIPHDSASWLVRSADGQPAGILLSSELYGHEVSGFSGPTPLFIYKSGEQQLKSIVAAANTESPDFFKRAAEGVFSQLLGKTVEDVSAMKVDAVSGATYSGDALIRTVKLSLSAHKQAKKHEESVPVIGWGRTVAVLGVLVLGILAAWKWRGVKWFRLLMLVLNTVVTGFWCGQFLSLSLVRSWIKQGVDPLLYLPGVAMLLVALVMPYFGRSHHYCQWVCPYGSLQELAWRLPLPKLAVPQYLYKLMRLFRMSFLMLLLIMLWFGYGVGVLDYEPFTAFTLSVALPGVIVLAALFVLLGVFVPRPWCRCLCPVGTLLELAEDGGRKSPVKKTVDQ